MYAQKRALPECVQTAPDDAELVKRFQGGEKSVFNQLMIRYQNTIYRLVYRYVENHEDALDVTQEAFLKAYHGLGNFKRASQFYTWFYRIVINLCINFNRRCNKRSVAFDVLALDELPAIHIPRSYFPPPSKMVENEELLCQIRQAMTQLTPMQRDTFMLRYYEGLSLKVIAQKLKREIGTIKSHLFFARKRLQDELRSYLRGEANEAPENQVESNFGRGSKIRVNRVFETVVE